MGAPRATTVAMFAVVATIALGATATRTAAPRFYPDDPIVVDRDSAIDASKVAALEDTNGYDFVANTFVKPGERRDVRAMNVNTVDDVPDSSWFTNRLSRGPLTADQIARGPDRQDRLSLDGWVVSGGKSTGVQPGFRMTDPAGTTYQLEFDPPANPEMATGAEVIGTAFYHAMGYHTVEVYIAELDPAKITISPKARVFDRLLGERRPLVRDDIDRVLARAARKPNGKYRVLASRFADGAPLGNFRYYGTRPDDPNDLHPHEHRRELRAARVFGAWLNHDDSRGVNSLDMLDKTREGKAFVKHYMFDFGSIMGSGTGFAQTRRGGNEYVFEQKPGWITLATLGLYTRPWMRTDYPDVPASVGRFEATAFDPIRWKPEYPNTAFDNMRADDAFWAARIVSRFSDAAIRSVVSKAQYSDPKATDYLTTTLITRRDKVVRSWITVVNPLVDFKVSGEADVTFSNAAIDAGIPAPGTTYQIAMARFDNTTSGLTPIGTPMTSATPRIVLSNEARSLRAGDYLELRVSTMSSAFPLWKEPVVVHLRRTANGWDIAGVRRLP
jgi:hypothetical protein